MTLPFPPRASTEVIQAHVDRIVPAYEAHLNDRGYSASLFSNLKRTARHIVAWLTVNESDVAALDIRSVDGFLSHDCDCPAEFRSQLNERSRSQAHRVLGYLIETGLAAVPPAIVTGGGLVEAFTGILKPQGYRASTIRSYRTLCRHFIVWLYRSNLELAEFDRDVLQRFLDHDCACAHPHFFARPNAFSGNRDAEARLARFASFLVERGVVADWRDPVPGASRGVHVDAFLGWLRRHRGVRDITLRNYDRCLRGLLLLLGDSPGTYDAASIRTAFLNRAESYSRGQIANEATALRSYLRFLAVQGLCRPGLVGAVPSISQQTEARLPRYVEEGDIEALIASCDTSTSIGLRDRAVLLLLARLALRPADITALQLGDLDWEQALIRVNGKSRRSAALPLSQEAGNALKDYILRARPRTECATVFLRSLAPHARLSSSAVGSIVRRAMKRIGVVNDGLPAAYLFRHSRATHLLRAGISLEAVGALLRHQSIKTTAIYARVDVPMLLDLAQPWPGELG